jgi:hypothetical protein
MFTGSRNGEIFLTDIGRGCFSKIDKINENITSIICNDNMEILASTAQNRIFEYVLLSLS